MDLIEHLTGLPGKITHPTKPLLRYRQVPLGITTAVMTKLTTLNPINQHTDKLTGRLRKG